MILPTEMDYEDVCAFEKALNQVFGLNQTVVIYISNCYFEATFLSK